MTNKTKNQIIKEKQTIFFNHTLDCFNQLVEKLENARKYAIKNNTSCLNNRIIQKYLDYFVKKTQTRARKLFDGNKEEVVSFNPKTNYKKIELEDNHYKNVYEVQYLMEMFEDEAFQELFSIRNQYYNSGLDLYKLDVFMGDLIDASSLFDMGVKLEQCELEQSLKSMFHLDTIVRDKISNDTYNTVDKLLKDDDKINSLQQYIDLKKKFLFNNEKKEIKNKKHKML